MVSLKDKCAIVGIGETDFTKKSGRTETYLAAEAIKKTVEDAGLSMKEIDGLMKYSFDITGAQSPYAINYAESAIATNLGIPNLRFHGQIGCGGGAASGMVAHAAAAIMAGLANNVVCYRALNGRSGWRFGGLSRDMEYEPAFGLVTEAQHFALWCKRHMHQYGTTSKQLGAVAVACRKHACLNPHAQMYGKPMTIEDHQNSDLVVDPFHLFDMCLETDGACAFVVTSAERARTLKNRPVYIMAAAQGTHPTPASWFCYPDFAISGMESVAPELYKTAGVTPKDIDTAQIYDCFTFTALCAIEGCGFCKKGEGGSFVEGGRIEIGGELPINTSGGNLSEGYIHGMTHINEAVRQLRGTAAVQVKDAELVLVTSSGPVFGLSSGLILRR